MKIGPTPNPPRPPPPAPLNNYQMNTIKSCTVTYLSVSWSDACTEACGREWFPKSGMLPLQITSLLVLLCVMLSSSKVSSIFIELVSGSGSCLMVSVSGSVGMVAVIDRSEGFSCQKERSITMVKSVYEIYEEFWEIHHFIINFWNHILFNFYHKFAASEHFKRF